MICQIIGCGDVKFQIKKNPLSKSRRFTSYFKLNKTMDIISVNER